MKCYFASKRAVPLSYDWWSLAEAYRREVKPDSAVLEIGASRVARTSELSRSCRTLTGVEVMPERTPADFGNVRYRTGSWENLSSMFPPDSFDIAVASHVIEHVKNDLKALDELHAVLKPGGVALINTPNRRRLVRRIIERFTAERSFPHAEHEREYTAADLVSLISRSRFVRGDVRGIVLGVHAPPLYLYLERPPRQMLDLCNFWQVRLAKVEAGRR